MHILMSLANKCLFYPKLVSLYPFPHRRYDICFVLLFFHSMPPITDESMEEDPKRTKRKGKIKLKKKLSESHTKYLIKCTVVSKNT